MSYTNTLNALMWFAAGDALSWQAMYHRSTLLPLWTRRVRREIDAQSEVSGIIRINTPFTLNNPVEPFYLSPTDDAEWCAFTAVQIIKDGGYITESHYRNWADLVRNKSNIKGSAAVIGALDNISKGLTPPETGSDNPHYFDDSGMTRAVPIGLLYPGNPELAAAKAAHEAAVTNSADGIWAASAMAAALSTACVTGVKKDITAAALKQIPEQSWLALRVNKALTIAEGCGDEFEALPELHNELIEHSYNYETAAPDNLALTLALFNLNKAGTSAAVTSALSLAKPADSVPAFTGALCGAADNAALPPRWLKHLTRLQGICIPELKDTDFYQTAAELNALAAQNLKELNENR